MQSDKKFSYSEIEHYLEIILKLSDYSNDLYLVGGSLRDWTLNKKANDFDFSCSIDPQHLAEKISQYFKSPLVVLDDQFCIYRVICSEFILDFSKFKGKDILADLCNRDFSINSMGIQLKQLLKSKNLDAVLDPMKGRIAIQNKEIIQNRNLIYRDDPLRLLRAYRISSQIGFCIQSDTIATIRDNCSLIQLVSAERIKEELLLLLDNVHSYPYFLQLNQSGLLPEIIDEIKPLKTCAVEYYKGNGEEEGVWGHSLSGLKYLEWILNHLDHEFFEHHNLIAQYLYQSDTNYDGHSLATILKLAILFHDIGKPKTANIIDGRWRFFNHPIVGGGIVAKILSRLKFSQRTISCVSILVKGHMRSGRLANLETLSDRAQYRFFRDMNGYGVPMLIVSLADHYTYITDFFGRNQDQHELTTKKMICWFYKNQQEKFIKPKKIIDGHQIMKEFDLKPGRLIGELLQFIQEEIALNKVQTYDESLQAIRSKLTNI